MGISVVMGDSGFTRRALVTRHLAGVSVFVGIQAIAETGLLIIE